MSAPYVLPLRKVKVGSHAGSKGDKLRVLQRWRYEIPRTFVVKWDAYESYASGDNTVLDRILPELEGVVDDMGGPFAVRSSANIEDTSQSSLAGQFKTLLNVRGVGETRQAIKSVWDSARSPTVLGHMNTMNLRLEEIKMAVLVQEMAPSEVSGVSFSKNPVNGLDEVIVEAVEGSGDRLVQDGVTPLRWVNKWGAWRSVPERSIIENKIVEEVVRVTRAAQRKFGAPVDLEWAFGRGLLTWLQLREITAIRDVPVYSNKISKEFLPGLIKPLVWSVNVPLVNGAWIRLMTEAAGDLDLDPNTMARSFHFRAYFSVSAMRKFFYRFGLPEEMLEVLMGIEGVGSERPRFRMSPELLALMPKLSLFAVDKAFFGRRIMRKVTELTAAYAEFLKNDLTRMNEKELIESYEQLRQLNSDAAYYNIVTPLLLHFYNWMLKSSASKHALDLEAFDLTADMDELGEYDPTPSLRILGDKFASLGPEAQEAIRDHKASRHPSEDVESLREDILNFLRKFGHLSDSGNDFSAPPWRENPDLVIAMLPSFATESKVVKRAPPFEALRAARKSAAFNFAYKMTRIYRVRKEQVGSRYTYGYGLFRQIFVELGKRFVARGILDSPEDIFYLSLDEVRECADGRDVAPKYGSIVDRTRNEMEASRDAALPTIIFGNQAPPLQIKLGHELRGVPSSRGYYSGPAKIVRSVREFAKLEKGDVLIIPYSDVGMTPLFSKAGAVVSESGGILSHSSIIAREYGIPAVVSVSGACSIPDNTRVSVDGFEGRVMSIPSKESDES